nr:MAG TPA: hypothetical protein [Caudoviricetes sp.]
MYLCIAITPFIMYYNLNRKTKNTKTGGNDHES